MCNYKYLIILACFFWTIQALNTDPDFVCPRTPFDLKSLNRNREKVALISVPGSGNTWVRHLLQLTTGYRTGSRYNDAVLKHGGFPGEFTMDGSVLVIKDHLHGMNYIKPRTGGPEYCDVSHYKYVYNRAIVVLRNPASAALAEFNRFHTQNHLGLLPMDKFMDSAWPKFVRGFFNNWKRINQCVLTMFPRKSDRCVLRYDNLVSNTLEELGKCLDFLGFPLSNKSESCVLDQIEGSFHRPQRSRSELKTIFSAIPPDQIKLMLDTEQEFYNLFEV